MTGDAAGREAPAAGTDGPPAIWAGETGDTVGRIAPASIAGGTPATLTSEQAKAFLDARGFGITPGLERIKALMTLLDNPQLSYPTIHLAGTNGKSSTARMVTSILAAHGLTCGLYTSPHLRELTERFVLAGWSERPVWEQISEQDLGGTLEYLLPFVQIVENDLFSSLTYFELTTALAFEWMAQRTVAVGVVETGMGGTWDATNLVDSAVVVLTQIDVDHSAFLGPTSRDNAMEKVGIIKPGSIVISAHQRPEVAALVGAAAREQGAQLLADGSEFALASNRTAIGGRSVTVRTARKSYEELFLPLHGAHQASNLALAVAAAEAFLDRPLDQVLLAEALAGVSSPGRLEVVGRRPLVVLDGAHNPHAAAALAHTLPEDFLYRRLTIVLSIFEDKDIPGILKHLVPLADRLVLTRSDSPRAMPPRALAEHASAVGGAAELLVIDKIEQAISSAAESAGPEDLVLITGSLHAVGQARASLLAAR
ncbi:MAG: bifunctional folylpolyglutamate synthase/dihydrofolate synthase [Actinomycetota bacterium]